MPSPTPGRSASAAQVDGAGPAGDGAASADRAAQLTRGNSDVGSLRRVNLIRPKDILPWSTPACDGVAGTYCACALDASSDGVVGSLGRVGLTVGVVAPACDRAVGADSARVEEPGSDGLVGSLRRVGLTVVVEAPASDGVVGAYRAKVVQSGGDGLVGSLGRIGPTPGVIGRTQGVGAPACDRCRRCGSHTRCWSLWRRCRRFPRACRAILILNKMHCIHLRNASM